MINIYFRHPPEGDKFLPGDRYIIPLIRKLIRRKRTSGMKKVFLGLCRGLDELNIPYKANPPFKKIKPGDAVIVLGVGRYALEGYNRPNKVIAGIGLMTLPTAWPDLCEKYPVAKYLQHSEWTRDIYVPYYGADVCDLWAAGIDTKKWFPDNSVEKKYDVLVYSKIMWNREQTAQEVKQPILDYLDKKGLSYQVITYGKYTEDDYHTALAESKAMIFLCEHESQGIACCEALAMNVPVLAWDQGKWLDPVRFELKNPDVPATSVPFFDETCGMKFKDIREFENNFELFWKKASAGEFHPRDYILENLTIEKSTRRMLSLITEVYGD
ncbi:glycosyltransferase [Mucilaginibacter sp.]|uniref:glycosyltransferase n=1 Tax=Mucilaginibacter sp. TaxID=1882438 RepID=UPI002CE0D676|nr:glycosyltransferase [Mucilaginibacter sp.]HTI60952.1 glycosyltransferase [Mucilaginibacter sp.]